MEEGLENCAHPGKKASQNRTGHDVLIAPKSQTHGKKQHDYGNIESVLTAFGRGN